QFRQNGGESLTVPSAAPAPQAEASLEEAAEEIALDALPGEETPVDEQPTEAVAEALEPWPDDWSTVETDAPSVSAGEPQPEDFTAEPEQPVSDEADSTPPFQTAEEPQAPVKEQAPAVAPAPAYESERDPELVEIFLEEGFDILESSSAALQRWMDNVDNSLELESLQRDLHTLKGGARMAEIREIGDLAHELEYLYEDLGQGRLRAGGELFQLLLACHDRL